MTTREAISDREIYYLTIFQRTIFPAFTSGFGDRLHTNFGKWVRISADTVLSVVYNDVRGEPAGYGLYLPGGRQALMLRVPQHDSRAFVCASVDVFNTYWFINQRNYWFVQFRWFVYLFFGLFVFCSVSKYQRLYFGKYVT